MKYFRLYPDVKILYGNTCATLYLLGHEKTFHLTKNESQIIKKLLNTDVECTYSEFGETNTKKLVNCLLENAIGNFFEYPVYSEGFIPNKPLITKGYFDQPLTINRIYIEIDKHIQNDFTNIQDKSKTIFQGCCSCLNWPLNDDDNYLDNYEELLLYNLDLLSDITINKFVLSGGNPFNKFELIINIIKKIKNRHESSIEIIMPLFDLTNEMILFISKFDISLIINVLLDKMLEDDYFLFFKLVLSKLAELKIYFQINLITETDNKINYNYIKKRIMDQGYYDITATEVILTDKDKIFTLPTNSDRIEDTNKSSYFLHEKNNMCLFGKLAIALDGSIRPCPFIKEQIGNLKENIMKTLSLSKQDKFWHMSKSDVNKCKMCEYRYACSDCSLIENDFISCICDYNPFTGIWENDNERDDFVWKL